MQTEESYKRACLELAYQKRVNLAEIISRPSHPDQFWYETWLRLETMFRRNKAVDLSVR